MQLQNCAFSKLQSSKFNFQLQSPLFFCQLVQIQVFKYLSKKLTVHISIPPATLPKLCCSFMTDPPPGKRKKCVFPKLRFAVTFFWEKISSHNKYEKCQFRFDLSNARNHMVVNMIEKKLKGQAATLPS